MQDNGFLDATGFLAKGWRLVRTPGLRRFVLIPLAINILVFAGLGWLLYGWITGWLFNWTVFERFGDIWILGVIQNVLQFLIGATLAVVLGYVFTLLANLIGAPFNSLLAERVEQQMTGKPPGSDPSVVFLLKTLPKTLASELSKLLYLALWMIPLLLLSFIPIVNVIAPFLLFAFGAWMFALEYLDYPMGNHGMSFKQIKTQLKSRRSQAMGFGFTVAVISIIPLLNLFIMPVAVAGATALYVERMHKTG